MKKSNYDTYISYIHDNFPKFYQAKQKLIIEDKNNYLKISFDTLNKILFEIEIINSKFTKENHSNIFLQEAYQLLNRIPLLIPINDQYILDMIFRSISESLLRLIVTSSHNKPMKISDAKIVSYTNIKKFIIRDSFLFANQKKFNYLYTLFSETSYSQHNPAKEVKNIFFINDQILTNISYRNLKSKVVNINKIFNTFLIPRVFMLKRHDLTIANRINIDKTMNKKEKIIFDNLPE